MVIEFRRVTRAGNNVHAELYFDHVLVAPNFNCTPGEFTRLVERLNAGSDVTGDEEVIVSQA